MTDIGQIHIYQDLISLFNQCFAKEFNTLLVKGADEPIYSPASDSCSYHQLIFAHGYYASALHEIAHWCIAGKERRLLEDFGYWYEADGRNEHQQKIFEQVEIKPQAVEWALCVAANKKFNVSADNLNGFQVDTTAFKRSVYQQVLLYLDKGFPPQAQSFIQSLSEFYQISFPLTVEHFSFETS
jgi:hypothetical protein